MNFIKNKIKRIYSINDESIDSKRKRRIIVLIQTLLIMFILYDYVNFFIRKSPSDSHFKFDYYLVIDFVSFAAYGMILLYCSFFILSAYSFYINNLRYIGKNLLKLMLIVFFPLPYMFGLWGITYQLVNDNFPIYKIDLILMKFFFLIIFFIIFYFVSYFSSFSLIKFPPSKSDEQFKLRIIKLLKSPYFILNSLLVCYIISLIIIPISSRAVSILIELDSSKKVEQFDTPLKRQLWWHSLDRNWKRIYRAEYLDYTRHGLDELKCYFGFPKYPDDDFISYILNLKSISPSNKECYPYNFHVGYSLSVKDTVVQEIVNQYDLTDLNGLANLTNLENLDLNRSFITDYSLLQNLNKLSNFKIYGSKLPNIDFVNYLNKDLSHLEIEYSLLNSIEGVEKLQNLKFLNCSNNHIQDYRPILKLQKLDTLIVYNNSIQDWSQLDRIKASVIIKTEEEYSEFIKE